MNASVNVRPAPLTLLKTRHRSGNVCIALQKEINYNGTALHLKEARHVR